MVEQNLNYTKNFKCFKYRDKTINLKNIMFRKYHSSPLGFFLNNKLDVIP